MQKQSLISCWFLFVNFSIINSGQNKTKKFLTAIIHVDRETVAHRLTSPERTFAYLQCMVEIRVSSPFADAKLCVSKIFYTKVTGWPPVSLSS